MSVNIGVARRFVQAAQRPACALAAFATGVVVLSYAAPGTAVHCAWYALTGSVGTLLSGWLAQVSGDRAVHSMSERA
jgi:hypothetical protein